ncbi:hypothetical protein CONCODRAFT_5621 [Conidiobolus coronatus NRRL 28638]|uniref:Uncharacterized protein n=1 Tax=Conidiobolus coronatus (strain ATCC 28846 / CBS 209.66 / NRRL 28638) TaxID=796925 RepID=A0A137P9E6_CONC2|nr:hypothetical protein CONCODRAFT_5621 [Conidiobolus coronatus NRRL 28638]|eukprot:KXN71636.1 hypothetical protein CONCODRAFT_5621 [Conidiobolus coronatus NRRL 28638]
MLVSEDLIISSFFGNFFIILNILLIQLISKITVQSFPSYLFKIVGVVSSVLVNCLLYAIYNNPWLVNYLSINVFIGVFYWVCSMSYFCMIFPTICSIKDNIINFASAGLIGLLSILQLAAISYFILYQTNITYITHSDSLDDIGILVVEGMYSNSTSAHYYNILYSIDWAHLICFKLLELLIKLTIYWKFNRLMDGNYNLIKSQFVRLNRVLFSVFLLDGLLLILVQSCFNQFSYGPKCFILTFKLYGEYFCLIKLRKVYLILRHRVSFSNLMRARSAPQ